MPPEGSLAVTFPDLTIALFSAFNVLRLASYLPQIIRIARDQMGAPTISCATWAMWIGANGSTAAYAAVNIHDWMLCVISAFNSLCCIIVIVLTIYKRYEYQNIATTAQRDIRGQRDIESLCAANSQSIPLVRRPGWTEVKRAVRRMKERAPFAAAA
jgi:hypothetical protein